MQKNSWLANLSRKFAAPTFRTNLVRRRTNLVAAAANIEQLERRMLLSNHAPVGASNTVTTGENVAYVLKTTDFGFTDPGDNPPNTLQAVKFPLLPTAGTLKDNGTALTANQFVSASDISGGKLVFMPNANLLGGPYFLCKFQVQDDGGTANGGMDLDPTAKVLDIEIVKVNHAPSGTSNTVTTGENVAYTLKTMDFGFTDPGDSPPNTLQAVKFTLLPTAGTLKDNGTALTVNQFVSAAEISGGKLVFTPNTSLLGGPFFLCKFQVQDNGGTANGGVNLDPTAKVLDVDIVKINHAPIGTPNTVTTLEDNPYTLKTSDFGFTDPGDSPANSLLAVKFTLLPGAGSMKDNGAPLTVNQFVSAVDINAGKLIFNPNANLNGSAFFLCKFQVQDNGGTAHGGIDLDPTPEILRITITSVNDAPQGTQKTLTTAENTAYTFKAADFGFSDPNDSPPNALLAVKITTLPAAGFLSDNGVGVTAGAHISAADIAANQFQFIPATNGSGAPYASFAFQVQDNGGTANGGVATDPTPRTMTVNVTATSIGPDTLINTYTGSNQTQPAVATDSHGDYVVAWASYGQDRSGYGVYAQRFNANGSAQGTEFRVNTYTSENQSHPAVAMDGNGDFVITWASYTQDGSHDGVYAQRFSSAGAAVGIEFRVNTYTTGDQSSPTIAMDSSGDFVIAWQSFGQDGDNYGIYARRYNAAGTALSTEFQVNTYTTDAQQFPSVAMDSAGDFVVTWTSYKQNSANFDVYAQRYNSLGQTQGIEFRVNTFTTSHQKYSSVAMDSSGDFVIAWQSYQDGSQDGIYAERYNAAGAALGSEFKVNTFTTGDQSHPTAAMDSTGDFAISWTSDQQDGSGTGVYMQRYNSVGSIVGSELRVNTHTTGAQNESAVALDSLGDLVIAFEGADFIGAGYDIFTQRYQHT